MTGHLPMKYRIAIGATVAAIGWTGSAVYLYTSVRKMKSDNARELEIIDSARKVVMLKAARGEYDGDGYFMSEKFLSDYEFYKMAAREDLK